MNFNIFKRNKHKEERALTYYSDALNFNNYSSFSANYAMRLSAVYRAVELISDSVAMHQSMYNLKIRTDLKRDTRNTMQTSY